MKHHKPSQTGSSRHSGDQIDEAEANLAAALAGLDQGGEAGLQSALNKVYGPVDPPNRVIFPGGSAGHLKMTLPDGIVEPAKPEKRKPGK